MSWLIHLISEYPMCVVLGLVAMQVFVLTAVAEMLSRFALNGNARWICNLWLLATASLLALPAIHVIGGYRLTLSAVQEVAQDIEQDAGERDVSSPQVVPYMPSVAPGAGSPAATMQVEATAPAAIVQPQAPDPMAASSVRANPVSLAPSTAMPPLSRSTPWPWYSVAFLGYSGVSCLLLARLALGTCRLKNLIRRCSEVDAAEVIGWSRTIATQLGLANTPRVLSSQSVSMPLVCGWRRPTVLVPHDFGDWPAEQQQAVLWHELAHVKRGDLWAEFTARLVTIIYWIHPAAWFTAQRLRRSMEVATDRHVLNSGNEPGQYARSLLAILQRVGQPATHGLPAVAMSAAGDVEQRVKSILHAAKSTPLRRGPWLVASLGLLAVATSVRLQVGTPTLIAQDGNSSVVVQEAPTVSAAAERQAARATTAVLRGHDLIRRLADCEVLTVEGDDYHAIFHVDGHVLTHDGQPVAGAVVVLRESASARVTMMRREDPNLFRGDRRWNVRTNDVFARTTTNAAGHFRFTGVKSPSLTSGWRNSWDGSIVAGHADFGIGWQPLGPKQGRERRDSGLSLVLKPTSTVNGSLLKRPEREPISDTRVSVHSIDETPGALDWEGGGHTGAVK